MFTNHQRPDCGIYADPLAFGRDFNSFSFNWLQLNIYLATNIKDSLFSENNVVISLRLLVRFSHLISGDVSKKIKKIYPYKYFCITF